MIVFSTQAYDYLGDAVTTAGNHTRGSIERRAFPDGERYFRIENSVDEREAALIGGTISEADTLEIYDVACALVKYGARSLTLVIPYFGYSTMERAVREGEIVTAKNRARLLSSVPVASTGNRVFLLDLHSEGIPHYFEDGIRPIHVYGKPIVLEAARELGGDDFVMACTDAGRAKWVESLANDLGVEAAFVFKRRADQATEVTTMSAQVNGRDVVIYDDMIRSGASLLNAARAYKDAGAKRITAITTHAVLPGDALERIAATGLVEQIVCTDSHPRALELAGETLSVRSIAELLAKQLEERP